MSSPHDSRDGSGLPDLRSREPASLPDRLLTALEILLAAGLLTGSLAWVPFASVGLSQEQLYRSPRWIALFLLLEASLLLLLLGCCQHLRGKSLKELGLRRQAYGVEVRLGMVLVPLLFLINLLMAGFFKYFLPRHFAPRNPLLDLVRTPADLALLVIAGLLAGGIKEEVQRAFILRRFEMLLGSAGLGLALWSAYFGWGHQIQGLQNAVTAGLFGFLFGVIYLWRRSLVAPMVSHSLYDTTALLLYWFFGRK